MQEVVTKMTPMDKTLEELQSEWKHMFQEVLPAAASSKSPSQSRWPVHVDHCFARIILDHTVGIDSPWMSKIKSPAYKNMSKEQLLASIGLGKQILDGEADLVGLNEHSLELRGKIAKGVVQKTGGSSPGAGLGKRKRGEDEHDEGQRRVRKVNSTRGLSLDEKRDGDGDGSGIPESTPEPIPSQQRQDELTRYIKKIALSEETSFRKRVLTALCQVPRGRYTTYGILSKHLSSSPRAVGNALRNNPFAPQVPCHRVLASGGGLGGFMGSWGRNGKEGLNDGKKRTLLRDEGVRFDGKGKVVGGPWEGFS